LGLLYASLTVETIATTATSTGCGQHTHTHSLKHNQRGKERELGGKRWGWAKREMEPLSYAHHSTTPMT